jgi:cation transport regulator ChaB
MGNISRASRARRAEEAKKPAVALSKKLQQFYASHMVSTWQREKVQEIRDVYKDKQDGLDAAHDIASSKLSEEYMAFELEYLEKSQEMKTENGGQEPYHRDFRRFVSPAFWRQLFTQHGQEV